VTRPQSTIRLHAQFATDGTPARVGADLPKVDEKTVCLQMVARCERQPAQMLILIGDKNFRGQQFGSSEADLAALDAQIHRPRRSDERGRGPHLAPIRQRSESIFSTAKDILPPTPLRPHAQQPARPPGDALRRPGRRRRAQPPPRPTQPLAGLLHHLSAWHNSSRVGDQY